MDVSPIPKVTAVTPGEVERAVSVILFAFIDDPVMRWCFNDTLQYFTHGPDFIRAFGGEAFREGTAYQANNYAGAALWLPPGVHPDDAAIGAIIERSVPTDAQAELGTLFEKMAGYHPSEPHWYLPLIGVDPIMQNKGCGSALLQEALRQCDRHHHPAYLESTSEASVPLYQRYGFEKLGTIRVGASPPLFPMFRSAR